MDQLFNAVALSHQLIKENVLPGMTVVDATCGNGGDTLFLAQTVGEEGSVFAFDIQPDAVKKTKVVLKKHGITNAEVFCVGHEYMREFIKTNVDCVVFNLGYLPSSGSKIMTRPRTTVRALKAATEIIGEEGVIVVCSYVAHIGGKCEFRRIYRYLESLNREVFQTMLFEQPNAKKIAPKVLLIRKKVDF